MERQYKDSGIEWIGKIPSNWSCATLLRSLKGRITDGPHETPVLQESGIPFISVDSLNDTDHVDLSIVKKFISKEQYEEYQKKSNLEKGDILFSKAATIGKTAIVKDEIFMVWSPLAIIKPSPRISYGKYMYYILNCDGFIKHVSLLGTYNTQINVGMRTLEKSIIPIPSLTEQQLIADYLDKKCGDIDSLIALQEQMIESLKAYRQSVITEAVTKGLDPNAKLVPSGIDWIGEIPEGWEVCTLKFIITLIESGVSVNAGNTPAKESEIGVLKTSCVSKFSFKSEENKTVNDNETKKVACPVKANTIIVSRMNTPELVGACGYIDRNYENLFLPDRLWQVHFKDEISVKFVHYFLCCSYIRSYYSSLSVGSSSSMQNISQDQFANAKIILPPLSEQQAIASYLDEKCADIDHLIALKQQKIESLKDYKKSIIYEAVTGKINIES